MLRRLRCIHFCLLYAICSLPAVFLGQSCQVSNDTVTSCSPSGQDCGEPTESNTYGYTGAWPQGTSVTVNINTTGLDVNTKDMIVSAITAAFNNWNGVGGVKFTVSASTNNTAGENVYNVRYGPDPDNQGANAFSSPSTSVDGTHVDGNDTILYSNVLSTCLDCFTKVMAHEVGHAFGLNDNSIPNSVLQNLCSQGPTFPPNCMALGPTQADMKASDCEASYSGNTCYDPSQTSAAACQSSNGGGGCTSNCGGGGSPTQCSGTPSCSGASCVNGSWSCPPPPACMSGQCTSSGCVPSCSGNETWDPSRCTCDIATSPIIIDTDGKGFRLTSSSGGVLFDFFGDGRPIQLSWTRAGSTNGWLAGSG